MLWIDTHCWQKCEENREKKVVYFDSRDAETALGALFGDESRRAGSSFMRADPKLRELGLLSGDMDWDDEVALSDYYTSEVMMKSAVPVESGTYPSGNSAIGCPFVPTPSQSVNEQQEALSALLVRLNFYF